MLFVSKIFRKIAFAMPQTGVRRIASAFALAILSLSAFTAQRADAAQSATVILYHRFGENDYPSTNIRLDQFDAQIRELTSGAYHVMALPDIIDALREGRTLPDRTVAITMDDAYRSIFTEAWPRLKKAGLPFTVFVSTDAVDRGGPRTMTWDQLRTLHENGVTIGHHSASHLHMVGADEKRIDEELTRAQSRFQKMLGIKPTLFAYPYGEFDLAVTRQVRAFGFKAAFGQQSGAFGVGDDLFTLPRFSMSENYGDITRFRTALNALPIPVSDMLPTDSLISKVNPPLIGFTIDEGVKNIGAIACYSSRSGKLDLVHLGDSRVEVRMKTPLPPGRTRLNCTMPSDQKGRWRWLGRLFYVPGAPD